MAHYSRPFGLLDSQATLRHLHPREEALFVGDVDSIVESIVVMTLFHAQRLA